MGVLKYLYYGLKALRTKMIEIIIDQLPIWEALKDLSTYTMD